MVLREAAEDLIADATAWARAQEIHVIAIVEDMSVKMVLRKSSIVAAVTVTATNFKAAEVAQVDQLAETTHK